MLLGVNIDHIATLRQARYAGTPTCAQCRARSRRRSGAVRTRRRTRHHDASPRGSPAYSGRDVTRLRETINTKLNLEMGNTPEIVDFALRVLPEEVCLVPENRLEITTEGGLDAAGQAKILWSRPSGVCTRPASA